MTKPKPFVKWLLIGALVVCIVLMAFFLLVVRKPDKRSGKAVPPPAAQVEITPAGFAPETVIVKTGSRVVWINKDAHPHLVASDPHPTHTTLKSLESIELGTNDTYSFTFQKKGTYTYHDDMNPYKLKGTVVVE